MKRSRISEIFLAEGLSWRHEETWFGERVDPNFAQKRGAIETLYKTPPAESLVVCLDEMGPQAVKSYPGKRLVKPSPATGEGAERARQEIDYGRRGKAGYVFGAMSPADGKVLTATYTRRTLVNWIDFLQQVEEWIPQDVERIYAVLDNLTMHRAVDILLFNLAYPRLRVCLPAHLRGVLEPDRTLVEDAQVAGTQRTALRHLERDRGGGQTSDGLLECTQASVWVGSTTATSTTQEARHCAAAKSGVNLADAPLRLVTYHTTGLTRNRDLYLLLPHFRPLSDSSLRPCPTYPIPFRFQQALRERVPFSLILAISCVILCITRWLNG